MKVRFIILISLLLQYSASKQDLASIRYHFTTCGAVGRNGPEISQCMSWYRQQNSSIAQDNRLFHFDSQGFSGSQGFRIDRTGYYDVTVAGAAGGRGVCSIGRGKGLLWKGRVKLRDTQDLLILVGQRGGESCDEQEDIPVCKSPPNNTTEASQCFSDWFNYLDNNSKLSQSAATMTYISGGGGGGGGASMIRIHDRLTGQFSKLPIVVVGGGGGTGSSVQEFKPEKYGISFPSDVANATLEQLFDYYVNAKSTDRDVTIEDVHNFTGIRGYIAPGAINSISRPGAGGGYFPEISLQQDGSSLNTSEGFAMGGFDCLHLSTDLSQRPFIETVHGGFGGGGGQCETGGSGGGYTGGSVFGNQDFGIPGNGGFYKSFSQSQNEVVELSTALNPNLDGFVELELTECGCGYKCVKNETEQTFWCDCPANTTLAPNLFDCFVELEIDVSKYALQNTTEDLQIKYVPFNEIIEIFSVLSEVALSKHSTTKSETLMCILLFINQTGNVILKSNVITESGVTIADRLAPIVVKDIYNPYFLTNPLAVSGVALASTGMCTIDSIRMNISVKQQDPEARAVAVDIDFDDVIQVAMSNVLPKRSDVTDTSTGIGKPSWLFLVISLATLGSAVFLLLVIAVPVGFKLHRNKRKNNGIRKYRTTDYSESMVHNLLYDGARSRNTYHDNTNQESESTSTNQRMKLTDPFTPKHGINIPDYNFITYNRQREMSSDWEYSRSSLVYMKELGEGHFGKVLLMKANGIAGFDGKLPVAVKTLSSTKPNVVKQFNEEANLMKELSHPNIIALLGVSFEDVDSDNAPLMILEYMPYGDLHDFLTNYSPDANTESRAIGRSAIERCHMLSFATDVANGLAYLFSLNFIHGDIATRNCLVGPNLNIKISDFGLTKKLEDGATEYKLEGNAILPLRWLSPESLISGKFSHASDIWSYGVLLWEIVTYGEIPLKNMSNSEILDMAERKVLKHLRPPSCPNLLFDIMSKCHQPLPQRRINVGAIVRMLTSHTSETV